MWYSIENTLKGVHFNLLGSKAFLLSMIPMCPFSRVAKAEAKTVVGRDENKRAQVFNEVIYL